MKNEIYEIPYKAQLCYSNNKGLVLPERLPYVGMGSSYFAPLVLKYLGVNIVPELASEFCLYQLQGKTIDNAVLISQSGKSSETVWCAEKVKSFIGITNEEKSPIGTLPNSSKTIGLYAGKEDFSSTKTYINTLVVLYLGFGIDPLPAIDLLTRDLSNFEAEGRSLGKKLLKFFKKKKGKGIFIIGSGPNIGTAQLAALIISETTKFPVTGMPMAQYDHGMKETAKDTMVIAINPSGITSKRTSELLKTIKKAGANIFELSEFKVEEKLSPLVAAIPFFFAAEYIASKLKIDKPFSVGGKVTTVKNELIKK